MKKLFKLLFKLIIAIIASAGVFIGFLTLTEFSPEEVEPVEITVTGPEGKKDYVKLDESTSVVTWNIGYAGLGAESDFFLDGGEDVKSADEKTVKRYLVGIANAIKEQNADFYLLQEVDRSSSRSYKIPQENYLTEGNHSFAINYSCPFVPYPIPPIGKVEAGVMTTTEKDLNKAVRISLPNSFSWPVRIANLKRCMLVTYTPVEGAKGQFVLVNFHLEAYDGGEGKIAQTKKLIEFVEEEYKKGNYVVAGGDWNQTFPESLDVYPNTHEDLWSVGYIDIDSIPKGWQLVYDLTNPTCRLLNQPYDPEDKEGTQHYVIDGFLCSPNVKVESVNTINAGFENSDHNPVRLKFKLNPYKDNQKNENN